MRGVGRFPGPHVLLLWSSLAEHYAVGGRADRLVDLENMGMAAGVRARCADEQGLAPLDPDKRFAICCLSALNRWFSTSVSETTSFNSVLTRTAAGGSSCISAVSPRGGGGRGPGQRADFYIHQRLQNLFALPDLRFPRLQPAQVQSGNKKGGAQPAHPVR